MTMDPKVGSPFPGLSFAGQLDDLDEMPLEITMTEKWLGYINQRVLLRIDQNADGRLAFVRFLPDTTRGEVIVLPCGSHDYGSTPLDYTATENGAYVNLRLAVKRLKVTKLPGRVRVFRVIDRQGEDGKLYCAFVVKNSATRPARKLRRDEADGAAGPSSGAKQGSSTNEGLTGADD